MNEKCNVCFNRWVCEWDDSINVNKCPCINCLVKRMCSEICEDATHIGLRLDSKTKAYLRTY